MYIYFSIEDFVKTFSSLLNISLESSTVLYNFLNDYRDKNNKKIRITSDLLKNWYEISYSDFFNQIDIVDENMKNYYKSIKYIEKTSIMHPFTIYMLNVHAKNIFLIRHYYGMNYNIFQKHIIYDIIRDSYPNNIEKPAKIPILTLVKFKNNSD
ncbi:MAG: hypothetical protein LBS60_15390 [Deltaproteobacteria bacterium]|jgi:hypothetical protein|nr:hypothetical protein [Deltaproteobacteria bacterium]